MNHHASKRRASTSKKKAPVKRAKIDVPEYHQASTVRDEDGSICWPAPKREIARAQAIIRESASSGRNVLIVPDKDADGLSAGAILRHTLLLLGLPKENIHVHLLSKGHHVGSEAERIKLAAYDPAFIFVVDQGSRSGPPLIDNKHTALIIDHHFATDTDFPKDAEHVNACLSPPVATSALLTYHICEAIHPDVSARCDWLCIVGTHGDLGNTLKWEPPFPDMAATLKKYTKKTLNEVVSLVNAPRRTATYDVRSAWDALCETSEPLSVLKNMRLLAARREVNDEVERCTHAAPKFSADGKVAVFRIKSNAQVHPVIATRWAGHLQSKALEIVLVANSGYLSGKINFSCRIPRCARNREPQVNIIQSLKTYASLPRPNKSAQGMNESGMEETPLLERLGEDFARGHVQASGGIVSVDEFEELMERMQIGIKPLKGAEDKSPSKPKGAIDPNQQNTLLSYFNKSTKDSS